AFGSLMMEGVPVRLAGQDSRRGTFVQRHAVFYDRENNDEWTPLSSLSHDQAKFWIYNSLLSEYAALGFEYGYSVERPEALVLWEAQFGDFVNGAQTVIDEFISSSAQKWNQHSSLVLLLPHGYEGQGPTIHQHVSSASCRCLQKRTCVSYNRPTAQTTSICFANMPTRPRVSHWSCSARNSCCAYVLPHPKCKRLPRVASCPWYQTTPLPTQQSKC